VTGSLRIVDPEILPSNSSAVRDLIRSEFIPVKDIGIQFPVLIVLLSFFHV
jgi:hypothetical protein